MTSVSNQLKLVLPSVTLIDEVAGEAQRYEMFELCALSTEGATLAGMVLLEVDEMFTLEFTFDDGAWLRVDARVVRHLQMQQGMDVAFVGLDETQKTRIACCANRAV